MTRHDAIEMVRGMAAAGEPLAMLLCEAMGPTGPGAPEWEPEPEDREEPDATEGVS